MDIVEIRMREAIAHLLGVNLRDVNCRGNSSRQVAEYGAARIELDFTLGHGFVQVTGSKGVLPKGVVKSVVRFRRDDTKSLHRILGRAAQWVEDTEAVVQRLQDHGLKVTFATNIPEQRFFVRRGDVTVVVGNMGGAQVYVVNQSRMSDEEQALADDVIELFDPLVPSSTPGRYIHPGIGLS